VAAAPAPPPADEPGDGVERPLDPRALPLERSVCWIVTAVLVGGSGVMLVPLVLLGPLPGWLELLLGGAWLLLATLLAWWAQRWPPLAHRHAAWSVDATGLSIRRGVWWRHVIRVPRSRVQHTDVTQGPLERRYGLGTLVVHTAGTEHAQVPLRGLDHALALRLRDHLLPPGGGDAV
jgi:membrane protein YdbS with pleckstrin-like domain